ncbi:MAG: HtaA domain-containing protein, partial [Protaetiibacter sp.]
KTLTAPTSSLTRGAQYEVIVWEGHTSPSAETIYARADVALTSAQWNTMLPPAFGITVDAANVANGTVAVTGTFPASYSATNGTTQATGVYLMYCVQPSGTPGTGADGRASGAANCNSPAQQWLVQPGSPSASMGATATGTVDGGVWTFTSTLPVSSSFAARTCLDAATAASGAVQCGVAVRLDHNSGSGAAATYTYDGFVPVTVPAPTYGITVDAAEVANGTVAVTGTLPASYVATAGTTLSTGVYLMYCVQPAGTPGTGAAGRAGGSGNCDATAQQWLVPPGSASTASGATALGTVTNGIWRFTTTMDVADAFGSRSCLDATAVAAGGVQCGIALRLDHNSGNGAAATYTYDRFVPVTFPAPAPAPAVTATVTDATAASGLTVRAVGTHFDGIAGAYAAIIEKGTEASVGMSGGYAAFGYWMPPAAGIDGGAFDRSLIAPASSLDRTKQYELLVWEGHTAPSADTIYARADVAVTAEQWAAIFPPVPALAVTAASASAADGLTARVVGSGFDGITGAYAAIIEKGTEAEVTASGGYAGFGYWATPGAIVSGAFDKTIVAPTAKLDADADYEVIVWQSHTNPTSTTIYARADLAVSAEQWAAIFPEVEQPGTETPGTTPTPAAGSLSWGVKASFRSYITGPIASGSISTSGASAVLGSYVFPQAGAAQLTDGIGSVGYSGSVRFTGHHGTLDLRLSEPRVVIDSPNSATLWLRVNGGASVPFAALALGSATKSADPTGAVRYANVPATLTSAGTGAFSLDGSPFYAAGTALDPVTFVIGSAGSAPGGTTIVASAATRAANSPAATPPATEGIAVTGELVEGGEITAEADGFQPNESGILVVIYSEPTVLAEDLTADAWGHVSWTGTLPRGLTGEHTLTFQGSVDRGIVLDIAAASELQCTVSDATLVWGFKESFRAYIDGSIANGEWTTEGGVSYATPSFTWTGGTGGADADGALDVQYAGSVRFTGHGGVLDTTIANPRVVIDGDRAVLLLDVSGTTQEGEAVSQTAVEFAELDLSGVEGTTDGDTVTWAAVPAALTAAGAAAFGTYPEGEALDPVTITATVESGCASESPAPTATDDELAPEPTAAEGWPVWATVLIVALLAAAIIAALVIILVRRRRA